MPSRRPQILAYALAISLVSQALPREALAQAQATAPLTADQAKAAEHFQRAKDLYQAGSYRDAIAELEAARALDPKAKELVFNLGIVHEKLARFDEAIAFFEKYMGMEGVTAAERAKAEAVIKRIEGAKREVGATKPAPSDAPTQEPPPPPIEDPEPPPPHGRVDALTIGAASVAGVSLVVGTVFGIRALSLRPDDGFVTGRDGTYADLRSDTDAAHSSAVVADIGFAVAVVAAAATTILYFGRTRAHTPTSKRLITAPTGLRVTF